ncbi:MAG TPA: F0F1 ATP synthase subunit gamma [Methylocella sp.]|nr:F0F1 ATP synthase subunit gamma [Methylocella sp.]
MTRLSEIQGHITSMDELLEIVGAMRSLAGMRVQEVQHALPGIRNYSDSMAAAIGRALLLVPQPLRQVRHEDGCRALILYMAEHGFVGGFNEKLLEALERTLRPTDLLFVLGTRGAALALERGRKAAWARPMASRLAGAPDVVNELMNALYMRMADGEIACVEILFSPYRQGAASTIKQQRLLPFGMTKLAAKPSEEVPLHNLPPRPLLEKLMAEYVFALLTEAAVESIASENAARFAAMESAHDNVSKKLAGLQENARAARQTEITAELLDLMTGVEAMKSPQKNSSRKRGAIK